MRRIATALSGWINVSLLAGELARREGFALDATFRRRFFGIVAACAAMGVVVFVLVRALAAGFAPQSGLAVQVASLLAVVGAGLATYLGAAHLLGAANIRRLVKAASG